MFGKIKYRRVVFDDSVEKIIVQTCKGISKYYDINVVEIGTDGAHIHFFIQFVPMLVLTNIVKIIKRITVREIYRLYPEIRKKLCGEHLGGWIFR